MSKHLDVDEQALAQLCSQHRIEQLALFGSVLRGSFRQGSDVDMVVSFEPDAEIGLIHLSRVRRELSELLGHEVDLIPENSIRPSLRNEILSSSETLYPV